MFGYFTKMLRRRRARRYLAAHPEDQVAVQTIVASLELSILKFAREVVEMMAGRTLSDDEWRKVAPRWERAWNAIR